jgi:hypothetical protein
LKKASLFRYASFLGKAPAEIPPFPPFEKGGRRGDLRRPLQKAKSIRRKKDLAMKSNKKKLLGHFFYPSL